MARLNIGVLAGGRSAEHEVSLQSARNVLDAIDREKYEPVFIGVGKDGVWRLPAPGAAFFVNTDDPKRIALAPGGSPCTLPPGGGGLLLAENSSPLRLDAVFPVLHGPFGEDGTVQGLLELALVPFVGSGVLASSAGMDKITSKRLFDFARIPTARWLAVKNAARTPNFETVKGKLGAPVFVKPANMGSSVGVSRVETESEYLEAVRAAFEYDRAVIVEEAVAGREIECAVLERAGEDGAACAEASVPGEIIPKSGFYSYEAKYLDADGAALCVPASLSAEKRLEVQRRAVEVFELLGCAGLGRVDFFLRASDSAVLVNEINTIPGFTRISMYPKLWEASGVPYKTLISLLLETALARFKTEAALKTGL